MDEVFTMIANLGFPIVVAVYLLIRIEGKLNDLTSAITELRETIITLPNYLYRDGSTGTPFTHEIINSSPGNKASPINPI
ncbi:MAG: YvrJ family protein [Syntrophomonas sp.]